MMKSIWLALGFTAVMATAGTACPVTLVENGHARAVIVIPERHKSEAATDLQSYIQKVSGATLAIVAEDKRLFTSHWR